MIYRVKRNQRPYGNQYPKHKIQLFFCINGILRHKEYRHQNQEQAHCRQCRREGIACHPCIKDTSPEAAQKHAHHARPLHPDSSQKKLNEIQHKGSQNQNRQKHRRQNGNRRHNPCQTENQEILIKYAQEKAFAHCRRKTVAFSAHRHATPMHQIMPEPWQNPLPCIEPSVPVCTQKAKNRAVFKRIFESPANCRINAVHNAVHPDRAQQRADCRKQAEAKAVFNYRRNFFCHRIRSPFFPLAGCALRRFPASSVPQPFQHAEHKLTFLNFQKPCKKHVGSHANAAADAKQQNLPNHASAQSRQQQPFAPKHRHKHPCRRQKHPPNLEHKALIQNIGILLHRRNQKHCRRRCGGNRRR